jgi:hypothetical protein
MLLINKRFHHKSEVLKESLKKATSEEKFKPVISKKAKVMSGRTSIERLQN